MATGSRFGGPLGLGLLWRPAAADLTATAAASGRLGFVEVIAESVPGGRLPSGLGSLRRAGATVVPHGVTLGLGGAARPDRARLAHLAAVADALEAPLISEHVTFVRAGGREAGHLLPVPRTRDALSVLVANVVEACRALPVPLALEPIATLLDWPGAELTEAAMLCELLDRTPVDLVLDLANVHVTAANRRRAGGSGPDADPHALLDALPPGPHRLRPRRRRPGARWPAARHPPRPAVAGGGATAPAAPAPPPVRDGASDGGWGGGRPSSSRR